MRRYLFYLFVGFLTFGVGSTIEQKFYQSIETPVPKIQEIFKTKKFGDFRKELRQNLMKPLINNQSAIQKDKPFICTDKLLSTVINDFRKDKELNTDFQDYLETSEDADCRNILSKEQTVDLNRDGIKEFIIRGKSSFLCGGTGNCKYWIYQKNSKGYKKLLQTSGEYLIVKKSLFNGYKNIFVKDHESAYSSYQITYKFDRFKYEEGKCLFVDYSLPKEKIITTCTERAAIIEAKFERQKYVN